MDHYQQLRRELDRLQPQLAETFAAEDRLLWDAETLFPGGQLQSLAPRSRPPDAFGVLLKLEQYAQLKIWIGRYRQFQAGDDAAGEDMPAPRRSASSTSSRRSRSSTSRATSRPSGTTSTPTGSPISPRPRSSCSRRPRRPAARKTR